MMRMTAIEGRVAAVTAAAAVAACGAGPDAERVERYDSAGVEVVVSYAPAWADGEAWRVSAEPLLEIGAAEGEPEYLLSRVVGALRLDDGRIVVGDGASNELRFYDADGRFTGSAGREGEGPGEFEYMRALERCRPGEISAFDLSWQLNVFDEDGAFLRSLRTAIPAADGDTPPSPYSLSCDTQGRFLMVAWGRETFTERPIGSYRTNARVALVVDDTVLAYDFGELPGDERIGTRNGSRPHPFGRQIVHAIGGSRVYIGTGDDYEIAVHGLGGTRVRLLRRPGIDLTITEDRVEAYRQARLDAASPENRAAVERELRDLPVPDEFPAYAELRLDRADNLWVRDFLRPGDSEFVWAVFAPDGALLGEVRVPSNLEITEIGADYLLGVVTDAFGIERVRLYALEKPGSGG